MKRWQGFAAAVVLLAGCSSSPASTPTPTAFDVKGTLTLSRVQAFGSDGDACAGEGGYSDITTGAQVKVSDDDGKVVGLGALKAGLARKSEDWSMGGTNKCMFDLEVKNVPLGAGAIYGVEVTHRGIIQFNRDEADHVALTLG